MQLSEIDEEVVANLHSLPIEKQKTVLEFSAFLKSMMINDFQENKLLKRQAGLGKGDFWMSDDFDEPLSDSFWLGDE